MSPLKHQLSLRGSTGLKTNAILGEVYIKLSLLQENTKMHKELGIHRWSHCKVKFLVADPSVHLKKIILGTPFMERHKVSLYFSPRPRVSAVMTEDSRSGRKQRVRLKIKSTHINLHLCKPIEPEDKTATFLLSTLIMANNFS